MRVGDNNDPLEGGKVLVALNSGSGAARVAKAARDLAAALHSEWEAIHIETPANSGCAEETAEALQFAAGLGATVTKLPAATVAVGLAAHIENSPVRYLVMGHRSSRRRMIRGRLLVDELSVLEPNVIIQLVPTSEDAIDKMIPRRHPWTEYAYALAAVAVTAALALALHQEAGIQYLSFMFFFPVIGSAARLGTKPAVAAAIACSLVFNFLFLAPTYAFKPAAFQSWIMSAALIAVALYTGAMTANFRVRAMLSERSAHENASLRGIRCGTDQSGRLGVDGASDFFADRCPA